MKKIISISVLLVIAVISFGFYEYYRGPLNIKNIHPKFSFSANELKEQLTDNIQVMKKFGNSVIIIEGNISSFEKANTTTVFIDSVVRCELEKDCELKVKEGKIRIKGILGGYDDLFGEALLVKCQIEEINEIDK